MFYLFVFHEITLIRGLQYFPEVQLNSVSLLLKFAMYSLTINSSSHAYSFQLIDLLLAFPFQVRAQKPEI